MENVDMLHGALTKDLLRFTLPIALSSIVQQLFHAADTAVVGSFGDASALAAVGTNTEIVALIVTISSGLSVGANVLAASLVGQGEKARIPAALQAAVLLAVLVGILGAGLGQTAAVPLLRLIRTPEPIFRSAALYLRIYLLGYPFLLLYDFGAAVLRAQGDSRHPFLALAASGAANAGLNLFFVMALRMGVSGVALATDLSNGLSAFLVLRRLKKAGQLHLDCHKLRRSLRLTGRILKTGIPSAIQGAVFCFANIFVQAEVNRFGETAIAGSTVAMNFEYFAYYIITAFGQTAKTFTSQNHAAKQYARCRSILWRSLLLSTVCSAVPILAVVLFRGAFSRLFSPDAAVVESAGIRILCILLFEPACNLYEIPAGVLRGCGHALYPAASTMVGTCAFRIIWIFTAFRAEPALPMFYRAFPLSWVAMALLVSVGFLFLRPFSGPKPGESAAAASAAEGIPAPAGRAGESAAVMCDEKRSK